MVDFLARTKKKRGTDTVDNTQHLQETDWRAHPSYLLPISPPLRSSSSFPVLLHLLFQILSYFMRLWIRSKTLTERCCAFSTRKRKRVVYVVFRYPRRNIFPFFFNFVFNGKQKPPQGCRGYIESGHRKLPRRKVFSSFLFLLWFTNLYGMKVFS